MSGFALSWLSRVRPGARIMGATGCCLWCGFGAGGMRHAHDLEGDPGGQAELARIDRQIAALEKERPKTIRGFLPASSQSRRRLPRSISSPEPMDGTSPSPRETGRRPSTASSLSSGVPRNPASLGFLGARSAAVQVGAGKGKRYHRRRRNRRLSCLMGKQWSA
jgi:hypothetical protein